MTSPHVLILGCGRSGTSIFGELFQAIELYDYHSEPDYTVIENLDWSTPQAIKVPRASDSIEPEAGLSINMNDILSRSNHQLHVFWIVRHPLDAIASLKIGISKNWGHHPRPLDWKQWLNQPLIEQCAHHWNYINEIGFKHIAGIAHIVKFEDMIENATSFALNVTNRLGLPKETTDNLSVQSWCSRVQNTNNEHFIEAITSRPYSTHDHQARIGRWKENLSDEEASVAWSMVQSTARTFGYSADLTN
ncbi:MAG: sulfotransferase domain-containing protein [Cyclobacteriaceae bacterium]